MAIQYAVEVLNAQLDQFEVISGASPQWRLYTGAMPANTAAEATGTLLLDATLPADWMNAASANSKTKLGVWSGTGAAAGDAGYFRLWDAGATLCTIQGTVTATSGGGDMTLDNVSIVTAQAVTCSTFTLARGNS